VNIGPGYLAVPFLAWFLSGFTKFLLNSIRSRRLAFDLIGYGGIPSTHSAIVSGTAALIGLREGLDHPAFGVSVALAFIVMLDASSLRRQIGRHAESINKLDTGSEQKLLRERVGHTPVEIGAGILVGLCSALILQGAS
jgi:acid phosphatase family membrane protein YuiD